MILRRKGKRWVGPGLVDLQINGYRGLDFNTTPVPADLPGRVTRELWCEGITSYLATVITNSPEAIEECCRAIAKGCEEDADARAGIAGIHLEGPFISPEDGPRGAHARLFVRTPDWDLFRRWQDAAGGRIRLVTFSPEWPGSEDFASRLAKSGVIASIGHTAAAPEQVRRCVDAGATCSTHLGNGAHLVLQRHPNYLWEQLADDRLTACFIADGFHLPDSVMKVILRAKGKRAALVSDAVYLSGLTPGPYDTHIGGKVILTPEGKLHLASNPNLLAGSVGMLRQGVERLVTSGIASIEEAWELASVRPAALLGLKRPKDSVVFTADGGRVRIVETYKGGKKVFGKGRG
jgi:N-acetylglucosamine-6-phosphate deacetylase